MDLNTLTCPIIHEIPRPEDIVLGNDNHVYSRSALLECLRRDPRSPITRQPMSPHDITESLFLKRISEEIYRKHDASTKSTITFPKLKPRNIINTSLVCIDPVYEKMKVKNYLQKFLLSQNAIIFGSSSYLSLIHDSKLIEYNLFCKKNKLIFNENYNNESVHPESYSSRQELKKSNDLDILLRNANINEVIDNIKNILNFCMVDIRWISYANTIIKKHTQNKKLIIAIPIGTVGKILLNVDIIIINNDNINFLGPFPNIIKKVCRSSCKYFLSDYPNIPINYNLELLEWCKKSYEQKRTITNVFINKNSYADYSYFSDTNYKETCHDILCYLARLIKELAIFKIDNLTITNYDYSSITFQMWDKNDQRLDEYYTLDLNRLEYNCKNSNSSELSKGKIEIDNEKYIHICCDPDFNLEEYSVLLAACNLDKMYMSVSDI